LVYYAGFNGLTGAFARDRARELLAEVGLASVENDRIRTFSQGMKKRFGLAAVMLTDPPNLLLDEVLNGLDPEGIAFVRAWVLDQKRQHKAVLLSSHLLGELEAMADRVAFVHRGHLIRTIDRADLARAAGTLLRITIDNLDPAGLEFLRSLGAVREDGRTILLANPSSEVSEVNAELVRRGYRVAELRVEGSSLEAYFLQLLGTAQ
jgi:ABC-2 type transport system ATP-binding protein